MNFYFRCFFTKIVIFVTFLIEFLFFLCVIAVYCAMYLQILLCYRYLIDWSSSFWFIDLRVRSFFSLYRSIFGPSQYLLALYLWSIFNLFSFPSTNAFFYYVMDYRGLRGVKDVEVIGEIILRNWKSVKCGKYQILSQKWFNKSEIYLKIIVHSKLRPCNSLGLLRRELMVLKNV